MKAKVSLIIRSIFLSFCLVMTGDISATGFGMQDRIHKRITIIHKLLGNKKYEEAIERLDTLSNTVKNLPYEQGVVLQLYGYVYGQKGDTAKAINYFEQCLQLNSLPKDTLQNIRLNIIQLQLDKKQYQNAEKMFIAWKNNQPNSADGYALGGMIFAMQKRYREAEAELAKAIQLGKPPKEEWLQALLSIYMDSKQYTKAGELLEKLLIISPDNKQYWMQLADVNYLSKQYKKAASVLDVAYQKNFLTTGDEIKKLAAFHYYNNSPLKSAKVLESGIAKKIIKGDASVFKLLAYYYINAKDTESAVKYLSNAVAVNNDISLQYTIAQLFFEKQEWVNAQKAIKPVLDSKDMILRDKAALMSGIILFELRQYQQALQAFKLISYDSKVYAEADTWKQYLAGLLDSGY